MMMFLLMLSHWFAAALTQNSDDFTEKLYRRFCTPIHLHGLGIFIAHRMTRGKIHFKCLDWTVSIHSLSPNYMMCVNAYVIQLCRNLWFFFFFSSCFVWELLQFSYTHLLENPQVVHRERVQYQTNFNFICTSFHYVVVDMKKECALRCMCVCTVCGRQAVDTEFHNLQFIASS